MKTVHRTPTGYHVIVKHSLGGLPVRDHVIVTAKVGKWEEFPPDTSVRGVLEQKQVFSWFVCAPLWQNISLVVLDQNSWNLDEH